MTIGGVAYGREIAREGHRGANISPEQTMGMHTHGERRDVSCDTKARQPQILHKPILENVIDFPIIK